jgi:hypothetical protein
MTLRDGALDTYLSDLRRSAGLSVAQVCERTKIQARFVEAMEAGRFGELPSNTHLRAFSLALAQACGGDPELTNLLVRRVLAASAPTGDAPRSFDSPAPAPLEAAKPLRPASPVPAAPSGPAPRLAVDGPALAVAADEAPARGLAAASARLRGLPLTALLAILAVAGALSYGASLGLERWKARSAARAGQLDNEGLDPVTGKALAPAAEPKAASASAPDAQASAQPAAADAKAQAAPAPAPLELALRARRDCWLVLEIDGKRLPTVTLHDGDKLRWNVQDKAKLLAGNVGALRVWWHGDNLGYMGELGVRANALVFERGHGPKFDKAQALPLPSGVPE